MSNSKITNIQSIKMKKSAEEMIHSDIFEKMHEIVNLARKNNIPIFASIQMSNGAFMVDQNLSSTDSNLNNFFEMLEGVKTELPLLKESHKKLEALKELGLYESFVQKIMDATDDDELAALRAEIDELVKGRV